MEKFSDQQIIDSWKKNFQPWVKAIRNDEIESRLLVTNKTIVDAVIEKKPKTVLDVGCGEGWLVRELKKVGIDSLGIDVIPDLIDFAQTKGGRFKSLSYEDLSGNMLQEKFDAIVCNFSLLGKESVINVFRQAPSLLNERGSLIVQTIHPVAGCREGDYCDGWREGSWAGFSNNFCDPAPWYFRTLETWTNLFLENGFNIHKILEPLNPKTKIPASIVFVGVSGN